MSKKKSTTTSFTPAEVQESANILLDNILESIRYSFTDIHIIKTSEEHQKDRGIDFQIEVVEKKNNETFEIFKLQNKGTNDPLEPLIQTENKGLISFQVSNRHIGYYRNEFSWAILFIVCDLQNKKAYWHPVQLDDDLDKRVEESQNNNYESIQIYIDPKRELNSQTFKSFLNDVKKSGVEQFFRTSEERFNSLTDVVAKYEVDQSKPLLDQLFDLFGYLYDDIRYVPIHLLIRNYPFQKSKSFTPYYLWFKVHTDNEDLADLFASIKVNDDGSLEFLNGKYIENVDGYEEKARTILTKLTQNHIYWISSDSNRNGVSTKLFSNQTCDCVACRYNRLDIEGAISELQKIAPEDLTEGLKYAYMHYQLGNYYKAAQLFEVKAKQAKVEDKEISHLITQYNLIKLGRFIRNNYYDHGIIAYGGKIEKINLDNIIFKAPNSSYKRKMLLWIKEQRFFYESIFDIHGSSSKLRDDYQSHIKGHRGSNHYYDDLVNAYAQLNSFINSNYIIYDKYSEYKAETDEFIEGLFAEYSMQKNQTQTPFHLIDYHIRQLIFDGDHKSIWRYFNKYYLESVIYKSADDGESFQIMIKNLLLKNHLIKGAFNSYSPEEGGFWRVKYPTIFCNTLCVASIIEMKNSEVEEIASWITECFEKGDLYSLDCYQQVNSFLTTKCAKFSNETIKRLIVFFLNYQDVHNTNRLEILCAELERRNDTLILSDGQKKGLLNLSFGSKDDRSINIALYFYAIVEKRIQTQIKDRIKTILKKQFDPYKYYYVAMYSVFPFKSEFLKLFAEMAHPDPAKYNIRKAFYGNEDNEYPLFDMLMNLCFKYDCLPSDICQLDFSGFGDYYDWLLDIKNFNYGKFKIGWLGLYPTKFYFKEFRKYVIVQKTLEDYLRKHRDPRMERIYFDIYHPKV